MHEPCDATYMPRGKSHPFKPTPDAGYDVCALAGPGSCSGVRADAYHFRCTLPIGHAGEHADQASDYPDVILWAAMRNTRPVEPRAIRYAVVATITVDDGDGYARTRGLPTFYLDSGVQGIRNVEHARAVARSIVDPFGMYGQVMLTVAEV